MDNENEGLEQIEMVETEFVSTVKGPVRFEKGQKPWVLPWVAASLVGRGMAKRVEEKAKEQSVLIPDDLNSLNVPTLRKIAMEHGVENYHMLRKDALVSTLEGLRMDTDAEPKTGGEMEKIKLVPDGTVLNEPDENDFIEED